MATCKTCEAPIVWGKDRGGRYIPLDKDPRGPIALLPGNLIVRSTARSFAALPKLDRELIPEAMRGVWQQALDGQRYAEHDKTCRQLAAMRVEVS